MGTIADEQFTQWDVSARGYLLYADSDASYYPFNLGAFTQGDDFTQADTALNLTYVEDSVQALYDSDGDGNADLTRTVEISGLPVAVPVTATSNSTNLVTGVLYDTADGMPYDGTQDLVFISLVNASSPGGFGVNDYEARIPHTLGELTGVTNAITQLYGLE